MSFGVISTSLNLSESAFNIFYSVFLPSKLAMSVTTNTPWLWVMVFLLLTASWIAGTKGKIKSGGKLSNHIRRGRQPGAHADILPAYKRVPLGTEENGWRLWEWVWTKWLFWRIWKVLLYQERGHGVRRCFLFFSLHFSSSFRSDTADMELIALIKRTCTGSKGPRHLFVTLCGWWAQSEF